MTGWVFKRVLPSGKISWGDIIDGSKGEDGKRKQIFKSGFKRKLDADIALAKLVTERAGGSLVRPDPRTFAEFSEAWLSEYADVRCSPKTAERYREMMAHVTRAIGEQSLGKVTTLQLQPSTEAGDRGRGRGARGWEQGAVGLGPGSEGGGWGSGAGGWGPGG